MEHREATIEDVFRVLLDWDILRRIAPDIVKCYGTIDKVPFYKLESYGVYKDGEIIGLLQRGSKDHLYIPKKYRKMSKQILNVFEENHELHFWPTEFKDAKFFAVRNGYTLKDGEYVKCQL